MSPEFPIESRFRCFKSSTGGWDGKGVTLCTVTPFLLARPERFELPTTWFEERLRMQCQGKDDNYSGTPLIVRDIRVAA
jgi:hypothetical protein